MSVAANVAHSFVPAQPGGMADAAWRLLPAAHPQPGAVMLAAFWPTALLLAIEVLARVDWPPLLRWTLLRWGGVTPVAIVAAVVSYLHLSGLLHWYGEDDLTVTIGPACVDGLMVISTGALLALATRSDRVTGSAAHAIRSSAQSIETDPIGLFQADDIPDALPGLDPIDTVDPIDPIGETDDEPDPIEQPTGSDRLHADGSAPWAGTIHGVIPIESHRHTETSTAADERRRTAARAEDVARIETALTTGQLHEPLRVSHVMSHLSIGPTYARAAIEQIQAQQGQDQAEARRSHQ